MSGDADETRDKGVSTFDYLISLMGYAIGIGNVWRFPYLVGRHGGLAFVVVYLICLVLIAAPFYLLELVWGNTTRRNTIGTYRVMHPRCVGVGYCAAMMLFYILSYYNVVLSYAMVYMFNSFKNPLPWTEEALPPNQRATGMSATEHFYNIDVLNKYSDEQIRNDFTLGAPQWPLVVGLLCVYLMCFGALYKGIEGSAKVSYVTVGMPIVLMVIMFFRAVTLDGAGDGIEFYIAKFDGEKLYSLGVWKDAASQILFSLSPGMGTAITLSSFTKRKEDVYIINRAVVLCNSSFSIFSGFSVFAILGFMAKKRCDTVGLECQTVAQLAENGGMGLAFLTLAEGVSMFGAGSGVFSFFFFVMLLTLGLDSTFAWMETVNTYIVDWGAATGRTYLTKGRTAGLTCVVCFCFGLIFCTRLGAQLLDVIDNWVATYVTIIVCFSEFVMLHLYWGWERVEQSVARATKGNPGLPDGRKLSAYWKYSIKYTGGVLLFLLLIIRLYDDTRVRYQDYSNGLLATGWVAMSSCVLFIPGCIIYNWNGSPDPLFEGNAGAEEPLLDAHEMSPKEAEQKKSEYVPPSGFQDAQPMQPEENGHPTFNDNKNHDEAPPHFPPPPTQQGEQGSVRVCPLLAAVNDL